MGVLTSMDKYAHTLKSCILNTGTVFDLATGNFLPGAKGHMILNGGVGMTTAVTGREQTFKTTLGGGYFGRILSNYKESEGLAYDSELSMQGKDRIANLSGRPGDEELKSRMEFRDGTEMSMEELFETVRTIATEKLKNRKDLIRTTPFIDQTGANIKAWVPTVVFTDSFSDMTSAKVQSTRDEHALGDSKTNMLEMYDGKLKTDFARQMPRLCGSCGLYFISTAHVGNNVKLDPYAPVVKNVPMMSANDRLKRVGTQYTFLSMTMIQTRKVELLQDDKNRCLFPSKDFTSDVELQKVTAFVMRCKNNVSGASFEHVSSQFYGIQPYLDYYLIIKNCKSDMLTGTIKQQLAITDHEFTRHDIRSLIDSDYTFARALEVLGQFAYIRNRWNVPEIKSIGYVDFCKKLNASKTLKDEILNSTGIWSFSETPSERPYMSILDIIELITKSR